LLRFSLPVTVGVGGGTLLGLAPVVEVVGVEAT